MLQIESWLQPISETEPCGPNLEYDKDLIALETAVQGKPEQQYGDTIVPAAPPDWKLVRELAVGLLARTRDLRVAVRLAQAESNAEGFSGLTPVLALVHHWCEHFWPTVHPQLDPTDDNDPTVRINLLSEFKSTSLLNDLRRVPLISRRGVRVSLRDIALAKGELPPRENEKSLSQTEIDGAFQDVPERDLRQLHESLASSLTHLAGIDAAITCQVGAGNAVDFGSLKGLLTTAHKVVGDQLATRVPASNPDASPADEQSMETSDRSSGGSPSRGISGEVRSRDEVVKALDKICDYYEKHEPSSPIPLLLRRAQKLSTMNFLEIIRELAPGGLGEAQRAGGIPEE